MKSILQAAVSSYGMWNLSAGPMYVSGNSLLDLGYSAGASPNAQILLKSLIHRDDRAEFDSHFQAVLAGSTPILDCELRLRTKAGGYKWFELRGQRLETARRQTGAKMAYSLRNIHARKKQEIEALASHDQLRAIIEASEDSIFVVDPVEFCLIAFNEVFQELVFKAYGVRAGVGMRVEDVAPAQVEGWDAFLRRVLAHAKVTCDYSVADLNRVFHISAQTLVGDGRVYGICIFGHDVTERKRIEEALRKSEDKFSMVFREAPLALALISVRTDRYLDVNEAFVELTGWAREELIGKTPLEVELWVRPDLRVEFVRQVQQNGDARNLEVFYRTKSGEIREVILSAALIETEDGPCIFSIAMDITERKRALKALEESEDRLRIAIEAGQMFAFEWDAESEFVESSAVLELPNGSTRYVKQDLIDRIQPEDRKRYAQVFDRLTPEQPDYKVVFRLKLPDGRTLWLEESGRAIFDPDGKLRKVIGITSDVTEARQSEHALRELSGRLITSQEEERRRIARELHDHIGQEAALICVQTQRIAAAISNEGTSRSELNELYKKIKTLAGDISKLSHRLHSSELSFLGLSVAAERLCRDFADQYRIDVNFQCKSVPPNLDSAKALSLYRVLQEALQNIAKHSRASRVTVELRTVENQIGLHVNDNGAGFDLEKTGFDAGLGLLSMRERMNLVGGRFAIDSKRGSGTRVIANVLL